MSLDGLHCHFNRTTRLIRGYSKGFENGSVQILIAERVHLCISREYSGAHSASYRPSHLSSAQRSHAVSCSKYSPSSSNSFQSALLGPTLNRNRLCFFRSPPSIVLIDAALPVFSQRSSGRESGSEEAAKIGKHLIDGVQSFFVMRSTETETETACSPTRQDLSVPVVSPRECCQLNPGCLRFLFEDH